jgi:F-type H+-transporting ATPase subunit b
MKPVAHTLRHLATWTALSAATVVLAIGLFATPASAQAEPVEPDISHAAEQCIEVLEDGGTPEECQQAPDPFFPPWREVAWSLLAFTIVAVACWKLGLPAVRTAMANRTERIRGELATAAEARQTAEQIKATYQTQFFGAADEVEAIIRDGREQAARLRIDIAKITQTELDSTRARAMAEMEAMREQAMADVRVEAGQLAAGLTEHLVQRNLDPQITSALIDDYIDQLNRTN